MLLVSNGCQWTSNSKTCNNHSLITTLFEEGNTAKEDIFKENIIKKKKIMSPRELDEDQIDEKEVFKVLMIYV